jgi:hypothetical protein
MSGKEDVKGTQDTEKSRGVEEKIKALEQPHADAGGLKKRYLRHADRRRGRRHNAGWRRKR